MLKSVLLALALLCPAAAVVAQAGRPAPSSPRYAPLTAGQYYALYGNPRQMLRDAAELQMMRRNGELLAAKEQRLEQARNRALFESWARTNVAFQARLAATNAVRKAALESATAKFLREQAEGGSLRAMFELGECYLAGRGVEADEPKGWGHIRAAADLGHEPAQARWAAHQRELDAQKTVAAP